MSGKVLEVAEVGEVGEIGEGGGFEGTDARGEVTTLVDALAGFAVLSLLVGDDALVGLEAVAEGLLGSGEVARLLPGKTCSR